MAEPVTIPVSSFEYTVDFAVPVVRLWLDRAQVLEALFSALRPWGLSIDNVEPITTGKPSEQGINIKLPDYRASFFFGPAGCKFTKDAADWASVGEIIRLLDTARSTLLKASGASVACQKTAISLHAQPKANRSFLDVLRPFISERVIALSNDAMSAAATVVRWQKSRVVLDGSAAIANALFIRLEREFGPEATFEEIAKQLKQDEDGVFALLEIEEAAS